MTERNPFGGLHPDRLFNKLVGLGDEYAERDGAAALFEETRKPLLSQIALAHISEHGGSQARGGRRRVGLARIPAAHRRAWSPSAKAALKAKSL